MKEGTMRIVVILLALAALLPLSGCSFQKVESNELGVLINNTYLPRRWLPYPTGWCKGVSPEPLEAGRHFNLPWLQHIEVFTRSLQTIAVVDTTGDEDLPREGSLRLKTSEGNDVYADLTLSYSIDETRVIAIVRAFGSLEVFERRMIRPMTRSVCRTTFGGLSTAQFSLSEERRRMALEAIETLKLSLEPFGLQIRDLNVVGFRFNPEYEAKVREKEMYNQEAEQFSYLQRSTLAQIEARKKEALGLKGKLLEEAQGYLKQMELRASSMLYQKEKAAEALKFELVSRAEGLHAINAALDGPGGPNLVSYELARTVRGKDILLLPSAEGALQVTDVNDLLVRYLTSRALHSDRVEPSPAVPPANAQAEPAPSSPLRSGETPPQP